MGGSRLRDWELTSGNTGTATYVDVDDAFVNALLAAVAGGLPWPLVNSIGWVTVTDADITTAHDIEPLTMAGGQVFYPRSKGARREAWIKFVVDQ